MKAVSGRWRERFAQRAALMMLILAVSAPLFAQSDRSADNDAHAHGVIRLAAPKPSMPVGEIHRVAIDSQAPFYSPADLNLEVGDEVEWTNPLRSDPHTVYERSGQFSSPPIVPGGQWCRQFTREGDYSYSCRIHPWMHATVHVHAKKLPVRNFTLPENIVPLGLIVDRDHMWLRTRAALIPLQERADGSVVTAKRISIPFSQKVMVDNGSAWIPGPTPGSLIRASLSDGVLRVVHVGGGGSFIPLSADSPGAIWVLDLQNKQALRLRSQDGKILTRFPILSNGIVAAASNDRGLWLADDAGAKLTHIDVTGGQVADFPLSEGSRLTALRAEAGGVLWAADAGRSKLLRIEGKWTTEYSLPNRSSSLAQLPFDSQGRLWFSEDNSDKLGALRPDGAFVTYSLPADTHGSVFLQIDHAGNLWLLSSRSKQLQRISSADLAQLDQAVSASLPPCFQSPAQAGTDHRAPTNALTTRSDGGD